jgi:hypothetical protein
VVNIPVWYLASLEILYLVRTCDRKSQRSNAKTIELMSTSRPLADPILGVDVSIVYGFQYLWSKRLWINESTWLLQGQMISMLRRAQNAS